jgi:hypothetical protein
MNERQYRCLKRLAWDYNISAEEMHAVITGKASHAGHWDFQHLLIRMLERLSWYDLLELLDRSTLEKWLVPDVLSHLRFPEQRVKYERLGKILRGEPVSFAKWGPEYHSEIKDTLFSNRWYST